MASTEAGIVEVGPPEADLVACRLASGLVMRAPLAGKRRRRPRRLSNTSRPGCCCRRLRCLLRRETGKIERMTQRIEADDPDIDAFLESLWGRTLKEAGFIARRKSPEAAVGKRSPC